MTTPRDELVQELAYVVGKERAAQLADAFAHQLAEEQRNWLKEIPNRDAVRFHGAHIVTDVIDPETRR